MDWSGNELISPSIPPIMLWIGCSFPLSKQALILLSSIICATLFIGYFGLLQAVYGDIYGYGYAPYGAYSPATSPVPTVDGQMFGAQHYQYPTAYFQPPTPVPSTTQSDLQSSKNPEKPAAKADPAKTTNGVPNGTAHSNSGTVPLASSQQNSSLTPDGTYRAPLLGGVPSAGYLDTTYGYDSTGAHFAWYDGSAYANGQQRATTTNHFPSSTFGNGSPARYQNKSTTTPQMVSSDKLP
jgi:YTH domain-containing family protein